MSKTVVLWVLILLLIWNIVVFAVYGIDKSLAQQQKSRIPEKTLISMAFTMGTVGAVSGMLVFRHKTSKPAFVRWVVLALLANVALAYGAYRLWMVYR